MPLSSLPRRSASTLTGLAVAKLGKNVAAAAVDVLFSAPADWFIGGHTLTPDQSSFFIETKPIAGTNTRDERAVFIKVAFQAMADLLPNVATTNYIVLQDVGLILWATMGQRRNFDILTVEQNGRKHPITDRIRMLPTGLYA